MMLVHSTVKIHELKLIPKQSDFLRLLITNQTAFEMPYSFFVVVAMLTGQRRYKAINFTCENHGLMMPRFSIRPVTRFRNGKIFALKIPHAVFTFVRMLALQSIQMLSHRHSKCSGQS